MDNDVVMEDKITCLWGGVYSSCMVSSNSDNKNGIAICRTILIHY